MTARFSIEWWSGSSELTASFGYEQGEYTRQDVSFTVRLGMGTDPQEAAINLAAMSGWISGQLAKGKP